MKSLPSRGYDAPHVHQRLRKHLSRCTLDCGFKTPESPALRGFVAGLQALATAALYLVLKSNGPHRSKNFPVKFDFSPKTVPANIVQKLSAHSLLKSVFFRISTSLTNGPRSLSQAKVGTHLPLLKGSHTRAHTPKQGPSLPWPQCGFVLPAKSLLFRHAFVYIYFPVLCEPSLSATALSQTIFHRVFQLLVQTAHVRFHERKWVHTRLRQQDRTQRHTQRNRGRFGRGRYHYPRHELHVHEHPRAGCQNGKLCRFWVLVWRCSRRTQRVCGTAMRLCASLFRRRRGPAGLRNLFSFLSKLRFSHSVLRAFRVCET